MSQAGELTVGLGDRSYPVVVARDARPRLVARIRELAPTRLAIVTDSRVEELHLAGLVTTLREAGLGTPVTAVLPAGERSKTLATVEDLYRAFFDAGLDRKSLVVALGGGVVGDVAGFAAATWMRGIRVLHCPTTLLAMVDSAIGGKTGVDFQGKNLIGAFHQPSGVFASLDALATLPEREVAGGLGEVWKTAILSGEELFARLERDAALVRARDLAALEPVVLGCAALKAGVVSRDEREEGERALLNLGHTLGHALEAIAGFSEKLVHGEAVAIGIHFAARVSVRLGMLEPRVLERLLAVARALGLPTTPERFDPERALALMRRDKKAVSGQLRLVLLRGIGHAEVVSGASEALVREELAKFADRA